MYQSVLVVREKNNASISCCNRCQRWSHFLPALKQRKRRKRDAELVWNSSAWRNSQMDLARSGCSDFHSFRMMAVLVDFSNR